MSGIAPDVPGRSSNRLKSEVPPPTSTIRTCRGCSRVAVQALPQWLGRGVLFQPAVEGRLRLLQQPHAAGEAGFLRGIQREPLRGGVERGRHRDGDFLRIERAAGSGEAAVPDAAQIIQDERGGADRRDLLRRRKILRSPGQDRRGPVGRVVAQPGLGRSHDPAGHFACPAAGEAAGDPSLGSRNPAAQVRGKRVLRQIEERGQRRRLDQRVRAFPLRDGEHLGLRIAAQRDIGERRVGRAEIDADGEAGHAITAGRCRASRGRRYCVRT